MGTGRGKVRSPNQTMWSCRTSPELTRFKLNEKGYVAADCPRKAFYCSQLEGTTDPEEQQAGYASRMNGVYCTSRCHKESGAKGVGL